MQCDEPHLIHGLSLPGGEGVTVRPVCPRDADVLQTYVRTLSPDARYKRFFGPLRELPPAELDRVTHLDPPDQLGLIAQTRADDVIGEARYALSPDRLDCEFALSVADGWHGKGIGGLLLADLESRARSLGAHGRICHGRRAQGCQAGPHRQRLGACTSHPALRRADRIRAGKRSVTACN